MDRRKALKNIGVGFGAIAVTPTVVSLFQSCQTTPSYSAISFSNEQFNVVAELMEIIIPQTDIPGAKELKLPEFVDTYIDVMLNEEAKVATQDGLNAFIEEALIDSGKSKAGELTTDDWEAQLAKNLKTPGLESPSASFAGQLRGMTVNAFKINEFIGEQVLAYRPVPGEQRGCVDLMETTGGKAWSL